MDSSDLIYIDWNLFSIRINPELNPNILLDNFRIQCLAIINT